MNFKITLYKTFFLVGLTFQCLIVKGQLWQSSKTFNAYANSGYLQIEKVSPSVFILRSADGNTSSLTQIDTSGSVLWKKTYNGLYFSNIQVVGDSIWTAGYFYNTVQIDTQTFTSNNSSGSFIAVLNSGGDIIRYKVFNSSPVGIRNICVRNAKVYITGGYLEDLNLGTITLQGDSTVSRLFVAQLNCGFITEKATNTEGGSSSGLCIRIDNQDKILLLADCSTIVSMNGGYLSDPNGDYVTDGGQVLAKLDENLQVVWHRGVNGGIHDNYYSQDMFLDSINNCSVLFTSPSGSGALPQRGVQKYSSSTGGLLFQNGFGTCNGIFGQDNQGSFYSIGNTCSNFEVSRFSVGKILANGQKAFTLLDSISLPANVILPVGNNEFYTVGGCGSTNSYCTQNESVLGHYKFEETVSINEFAKAGSLLNIYPNPTGGAFSVHYQTDKATSISVIIRNELGQTILKKEYGNKNTLTETFDLSYLAKGLYFIQVNTDSAVEVKKIMIE